jgi:isopentenyl-diphosphate delta-isomerase
MVLGTEIITLVDENDNAVGTLDKTSVHEQGLLHRAFSILIYSSDKSKLLIHQRADNKYHSAGLWTNACCSHPRVDEDLEQAAHRRLQEEMGFDCELTKKHEFIYRVELDNGMIEHEYDHVFVGYYDGSPDPNPNEVKDWKYVDVKEVSIDIELNPQKYSYWFKEIYKELNLTLA